jgi:hypothetical protein
MPPHCLEIPATGAPERAEAVAETSAAEAAGAVARVAPATHTIKRAA